MTLRTLQTYLKILKLHGRIFLLFSQFIFSILTRFQCAHNVNNFFLIILDKGLKKQKGVSYFQAFL